MGADDEVYECEGVRVIEVPEKITANQLRLYQLLIFSPCCHAMMIYAKDDVEVGVCVECGEDYPTVSAETDEWM